MTIKTFHLELKCPLLTKAENFHGNFAEQKCGENNFSFIHDKNPTKIKRNQKTLPFSEPRKSPICTALRVIRSLSISEELGVMQCSWAGNHSENRLDFKAQS